MPNQNTYGFVGMQQLWGQRTTEVGIPIIRTAITDTVNAYNDELNAMLEGWVERFDGVPKEVYRLPGDGTLQPMDEWGNPLPVQFAGQYEVGYPIKGGGTAWGTNRITSEMMTVGEAADLTTDAIRRDSDWMRRHLLASILNNTGWTFHDVTMEGYVGLGDLPILPLANGDAVKYLLTGNSQPTTHNHYSGQADPIDDANNPYKAIHQTLLHHPSNRGPFVSYIATDLVDDTEALDGFKEDADPDLELGTGETRLSARPTAQILGPGDLVLGKVNRQWIVEWRNLPPGIILSVALGAGPFVRQREWPVARLKGLFPEFHSPDGALNLNKLMRYCGFAVRNRVAAHVHYVGNATYQIPTAYANVPLPV